MSLDDPNKPACPPGAHARGCAHTRRDFLRRAGYAAGGLALLSALPAPAWADIPTNCATVPPPGAATPFTPDTSLDIRPRKSAFMLSNAERAQYKAAYQKLRQLPADDPRTWLLQANVHCNYCGGGTDGNPTAPEIHGGWWFFPWHRAYLHFHERILASLVGDPNFRLAYWDWDTVDNPNLPVPQQKLIRATLPPPFTSPNSAANSLFDQNRGVTPTDAIPAKYVGPAKMASRWNAPDFATIGGSDPDSGGAGGNVENGPHGAVHVWTGDVNTDFNNPRPDMGVLMTAAQDPVFFAHHSNIDRIWSVWNGSDPSHTNPQDGNWLSQTWQFYDENKQWRSISVQDVIKMEDNLRYSYAPTSLRFVRRPPLVKAITKRPPIPQEIRTKVDIAAAPDTPIKVGADPHTKRVTLPADFKSRLLTADKVRPGEARRRYYLHIEGIHVPPNQSAIVHVFANLPAATAATSAESPNFLDYFVSVAKTTREGGHRHRPFNVVIDVTDKLPRLLGRGRDLSVTLVPVAGGNRRPRGGDLAYERLYISEKQ